MVDFSPFLSDHLIGSLHKGLAQIPAISQAPLTPVKHSPCPHSLLSLVVSHELDVKWEHVHLGDPVTERTTKKGRARGHLGGSVG